MNIRFEPVSWSHNASFYEVNLRQYTEEGSFAAFGKHLPRLADMGVTALWFMPVTPISQLKRQGTLGSYYACSSYVQTNPEFGTVADFRELVRQSHALGLKVIIDWVANHTGWDHEWTLTNPGYYKTGQHGEFYDNYGWADVIDLNYYDQAMRREMIRAMEFWVRECDIDGFRCDMAHLVPLDFWRDARRHLDAVKKLFWLAETEQDIYQHVFDSSYAWRWMHLTGKLANGQANTDDLRRMMADYEHKRLPQARHLFFTSNHDENSWNGTEYEKYGNAALCFAAFACTWSGHTLVYSGQELPNHKRLQFFDKDPISWTGTYALHDFYKALLTLRKSFGAAPGTVQVLEHSGDRNVFVYRKSATRKTVLVVLNLSPSTQTVPLEALAGRGRYHDVLSPEKKGAPPVKSLQMEPWGYLVLEKG